MNAMPDVSPQALRVGDEHDVPHVLRREELDAVCESGVVRALCGQCLAGVSALSPSLPEAPGIDEAAYHLADASLGDADPEG